MVVDLLCVLEDGSDRSPAIPAARGLAALVQLARGSDATVRLRAVTAAGVPVDLSQAGWALSLAVKLRPADDDVVLSKAATANPQDGPGRADVAIAAADTAPLALGRYFFDVVLTRGASGPRDQVLPVSILQLVPTCA